MNNNVTEAYPGPCKDDCEDSGFWYIALFSLFVFIHSTSEVGSMLLILRCVHPQDKAMALGLIQFAIGLFGKFNDSDAQSVCKRHFLTRKYLNERLLKLRLTNKI